MTCDPVRLTSIYSTTGNPHLPQPKREVMELLLAPPPQEREPFIRFNLDFFRALTGPRFGFDIEGMGQDLPHGEAWARIAKDIIAHTKEVCG